MRPDLKAHFSSTQSIGHKSRGKLLVAGLDQARRHSISTFFSLGLTQGEKKYVQLLLGLLLLFPIKLLINSAY